MSQRMLEDLARAAGCVALLGALGARIRNTFVGSHGPTINLLEPGALADHLDARQIPITCSHAAQLAVVDGCLITWPAEVVAR